MALESRFQGDLVKELKRTFPGCYILKNDSGYMQGVPDLILLVNDRWAMLEVKKSGTAAYQPNQEYYIEELNKMGFSSAIYPANKDFVLDDLVSYFNRR